MVACCNQLLPVDNTKIRAMTDDESKYIKINISKTGTAVSVLGATFAAKTSSIDSKITIKVINI